MKKTIRFVFAILFTPIAVVWAFLDWLYDAERSSIQNWKKHITFSKLKDL